MDKSLILNKIKKHYSFKSDSEFAKFLGITPQVLSNWKSRNTFDVELIYTKCLVFNSEWLLTGEEPMLKNPRKFDGAENAISELKYEMRDLLENYTVNESKEGIPLIPIEAMAGYGGGEMQIMEFESERFVVPTFKGADFLIQVKGSSMYPKYNSGDIVACKKLQLNDLFFQWNKVYVLDTEQGALIKRIDIASDDDHVMIVSDNEKYRPFPLHKSKINAISIVMGVIRLE
jgi:repressor LexA